MPLGPYLGGPVSPSTNTGPGPGSMRAATGLHRGNLSL
ncbi:F-box domain protein [Aspergillus luchuensis]|uniref:F-box domain protein n=1 Tax=Aspergillus kawachii TaxID=1069201 RepID=A0A146G094_ASPKA|nr:F-box domain protein [Aspergillus luchuensis]